MDLLCSVFQSYGPPMQRRWRFMKFSYEKNFEIY